MIQTPALEFRPILPEILLCTFAIVGMLYEAFARRPDPVPHLAIATVGILAAVVSASALWHWTGSPYVMGDTVAVDKFSVVSRFVPSIWNRSTWGVIMTRGEKWPFLPIGATNP